MKKFIVIVSAILLIFIAALSIMTSSYSKTDDFKEARLPENTKINGIDCSGLDYEKAKSKLTDGWNQKYIVVNGSLNENLDEYTDFGCTYKIDSKLENLKKNYLIFAALNHYTNIPLRIKIPMLIDNYSPEFKEKVIASNFLNNPNATESKNAYVNLSDPEFEIIPEQLGTAVDSDKFFKDVLHHIETGKLNFIYDDKTYLIAPEITSDDPELKKYQEFCKKYLTQKITYEMGDETFTIAPETLSTLFKSDMSGNADESAVENYIKQMADSYDNVGAERSFKTLAGKNIKIKGGTYGWTIDKKKEAMQLTADINSHKDISRKPVYSFESYGTYTKTMGNTYVDIDFTKQQVKFFKDGKEKFSCSVVTGSKIRGDSTPEGTYYILNRLRHVVMRGDNDDGTRYEEPASYWMGVTWNGIGMHDSSWRTKFGGDIWKTNGSHGCINMPKKEIPKLFNMVEENMPVVMHY
ncbi:MAG: L,D-transpeptidase family protein [Anaerovoracaceae bacterium]